MIKKNLFSSIALSLLLIVSVIVGVVACHKDSSNNSGGGGTASVSIKDFAFAASSLSVSSGTTVTWTNNDATAHTVTADDGSFDSGNIAPGGTYKHTFSSTGTVAYHCAIHPGMTAAVIVN